MDIGHLGQVNTKTFMFIGLITMFHLSAAEIDPSILNVTNAPSAQLANTLSGQSTQMNLVLWVPSIASSEQ